MRSGLILPRIAWPATVPDLALRRMKSIHFRSCSTGTGHGLIRSGREQLNDCVPERHEANLPSL